MLSVKNRKVGPRGASGGTAFSSGADGGAEAMADNEPFLTCRPPILHSDKDYMFDSRAGGRRLFKRDRQEHEAG